MSLSKKLNCPLIRQVLDCARVAVKERDLVRECIDHAKACQDCTHYVNTRFGLTVEQLEKYLELEAWPEHDAFNLTQESRGKE